jgi:outer membrane protein assembly factor BamB
MKRTSIALLCFVLTPLAAPAQERIALREGIVIDPTQPVAYVMTPERGIAAVDLTTGAKLWTSTAAAKPLALVGNRLVSQVESPDASNQLEIAALDVRERGTAAARKTTALPAGVRVSVGETLAGTFTSTGRPEGANVLVAWSWLPVPIQGMREDADREPDGAKRIRPARPITGGVRVNPTTGAVTRVADVPRIPPASSTWLVPAGTRLAAADAKGTQYDSADGRHVLVSERVADDRTWDKYRWTVYERATGRKLGETRSPWSFAPFVVRDSILVFDTTPFTRGQEEQPAKLRGVSLDTGREAWSVEVREVVYRGPMPP